MSFDNQFHGSQDVPNNSQWSIAAESLYADRDIWTPTVDKKFPLGALAESRDGRRWRYQEEAGNGLAIAVLCQSAAADTDAEYEVQTNNPSIWVAEAKIITVTSTATIAVHEFIDGYIYVPDGTGQGNMYTVKDNKVSTANATTGFDTVFEIADQGGIRTAIVAASDVTLWKNKFKDTIIFPTDPTGPCTGVTMTAITAGYFFWGQTRGYCPVLEGSETTVIGDIVAAGTNTAGATGLPDGAASMEGDVLIGYVAKASAATSDYGIIDLTIE